MDIPEREYIDAQIAVLRREITTALGQAIALVEALRREIERDRQSHEREHSSHADAHAREHELSQIAIVKAEQGTTQQTGSIGESVKTLTTASAKFVIRDDVDLRVASLVEQLTRLKEEIDKTDRTVILMTGRAQGQAQAWGIGAVAVSLLLGIAGYLAGR